MFSPPIKIDRHDITEILLKINRRDNQEWTIHRKWQHRVHKAQDEDKQNKKHNTICVGHHYAQTNTNNVNQT